MSYPPPPPPGAPQDPTQAFPPSGQQPGYPPQQPGYPPQQPGYTPPPPPGGYPPGGPGGYSPGQPSGKKGMSSGVIIGIAAIVLFAVLAAGVGIFLVTRGGDDEKTDQTSTTTTTTTTTEASTTTDESSTTTTEESTTTGGGSGEEISIDGGSSTGGSLDASGTPQFHDVVVPDGVVAIITVTPDNTDLDVVVEADGQEFDEGFSGEAERIRVTGPDDFSLEVSAFLDTPGSYSITIEEE